MTFSSLSTAEKREFLTDAYRNTFRETLLAFNAETPTSLSDAEKAEFFDLVKENWETEKAAIASDSLSRAKKSKAKKKEAKGKRKE